MYEAAMVLTAPSFSSPQSSPPSLILTGSGKKSLRYGEAKLKPSPGLA